MNSDTQLERELQELEVTFAAWEKTEKERIIQNNQTNRRSQQINQSITNLQDICLFMYFISLHLLVKKCERNIQRKLNTEEFFIVFFIHLQIILFIVRNSLNII